MLQMKVKRVLTAILAATMVVTSAGLALPAAVDAAPMSQSVSAEQVSGTLTGGQFAKIWLDLIPQTLNQQVTVVSEWEVQNPGSRGLGFYLLTESDLQRVVDGANIQQNNLSSSARLGSTSADNTAGVQFTASGAKYVLVVYNDSETDANFTLRATNALIQDGSGQVRAPGAASTAEGDEAGEGSEPMDDAAAQAPTPAPQAPVAATTPAPVAPATTDPVTATAPVTPTDAPVAAPSVSVGPQGEVRALELRGELPEQNAQHYLGLEPSERDGQIVLTLSFDPQDSTELARRLNFWVLDQSGFRLYQDPNTNSILSQLAIAAGSSQAGLQANQRRATFNAAGFGPYTVIVYNNSTVPGSYNLVVSGGILIDDAGQTLTAQRGVTTTVGVTESVTAGAATPVAAQQQTAAAAPAAGSGRQGEPGGTYTVRAGDTLSLIARDIYGDLNLWRGLCSFNNLSNCNTIEVGQVLQLPTREQINAGATAATTPAPAATPVPVATAAPATPETEAVTPTTEVTPTTPLTPTEAITGTGTTTDTGTTTGTTGGSPATGSVDLVAALNAAGSFDTLVTALEAAGLSSALQGAGPFTIFAPTDAAFAALPPGALEQLLANPTGQLTQILLFHVLPGAVASADVSDGMQATTQQGKAVKFEITGSSVKINGANVVVPDIVASNGVVHAIDAVILPPSE
jgi:uncharacterized surface protein with fasciclin (FAS1) repeats